MNALEALPRLRRTTRVVRVGQVAVGGSHPIVVQSMTDTPTAEVQTTTRQIAQLAHAGSELVRMTVDTVEAARAVPAIRAELLRQGITVPLVGDFHYNGHKLLREYPDCARALDKYRINPGNVGQGSRRDDQFAEFIELACLHAKPIRIGVNWGSLDQAVLARFMDENASRPQPWAVQTVMRAALVASALESAAAAERWGVPGDRIVLSCKVSGVQDLILVYRELARLCDYPLHLGLTEAGMGTKGIAASCAALGILLQEGIGDTIRISLTPEPGGERAREVTVAQELLQTMGLRDFTPLVTACPGCGRTSSTYFQELAGTIQDWMRGQMVEWKSLYPGVEQLHVAIMGCVVNGPGESRLADIGISLPGAGEYPVAPVYIEGERVCTLKGDNIAREFQKLVLNYVERRFAPKSRLIAS